MNRFERPMPQGEAVLQYLDGDFRIVKPGAYVTCAVTGERIPLADLRYWNVDRQEAYANPEVAMRRYVELREASSG
ncbi:DUF2093 domain-containing protein [Lutibaculum baratangense]|uniref:DUF2093 domain-containing protein n=1 Tax=Lutibaculum baratangense AMV1 TaxID=631454 RepID=V4TFP9_9HYPH|nr:DUF2093 domain-containing protein [Lutibaculum baratangense]ESR24958.1 uncharacterized protein N177_2281 [Lutibaculum baratangense AMV1]